LFFIFSEEPGVTSHSAGKREESGRAFLNYDDLTKDINLVLFGDTNPNIDNSRLSMTKRFLEAVYKLKPFTLNVYGENNIEHYMEQIDLVRLRVMCSLPVTNQTPLVEWKKSDEQNKKFLSRHPGYDIAKEHLSQKALSLKDHSFIGQLYALEESEEDEQLVWTKTLLPEKIDNGDYRQYRLDLIGLSPTTLLMFVGIGCYAANCGNDYKFYLPKQTVHLHGFNQRQITEIARMMLGDDSTPGLMEIFYGNRESTTHGTIPYLIYPYHETIVIPSATNLHVNETDIEKENKNKKEKEQKNEKMKLACTLQFGSDGDTIEIPAHSQVNAYDIDYDSICLAYHAVFGKPFETIYKIDESMTHPQLRAMLAMGCLIKDIDTLCNAFKQPEQMFPYLHQYLEKRISDLIINEKGKKDETLQILSIGRTIPEAFIRIRLMFRFLLGDTFHGIVDGISRLTALCYCWIGMKPELNCNELFNSHQRLKEGKPSYAVMTSPSMVSLVVCASTSTSAERVLLTPKKMDQIVEYSVDTQREYGLGESLSIQSVVLDILGSFKKGFPFTSKFEDPFMDDIERVLEEETAKMEQKKKASAKGQKKDTDQDKATKGANKTDVMDDSARRDKAFKTMYKYLLCKLGNSNQKEISQLWKGKSVVTLSQKFAFLEMHCKMYRCTGRSALHLIEMIVRFLLMGCVFTEKDDANHSYAHAFITDLEQFVANNGKNWSSAGDVFRHRMNLLKNPIRRDSEQPQVVEQPQAEQQSEEEEADDLPSTNRNVIHEGSKDVLFFEKYLKPPLTTAENVELKKADGNKNLHLMVCVLCCLSTGC